MQKRNRRRINFFTLFITLIFLINTIPAVGQDIVVTDDISGGFVFRGSSLSKQKTTAYKNASSMKRKKTQRSATIVRVRKQSVAVIKVNPGRIKSKEVSPTVLTDSTIARKPKEEVSVIFAGAGEYYLEKKEFDKAVAIFRESIILDEKNTNGKLGLSDALTRKGDSLLEQEQPEMAKFFYVEAIKYNEKNANAFAGLGEVFDFAEENDKALENYLKGLSLNAQLTELYTPIGVLHYQKGEIAQADAYLTKALAVSADNAETQMFLGLVRYKQNKIDEALAAFQRAISLDPESAEAHYYLGETLDNLGKNAEAIAEYKKAIEINPKYTEAWFDLGVAYYNGKNYEEAINAYKQTIKLKNDMGEAHANLADVYRQMDRLDDAISEYRLAVAFIKNDAELYSKYGYVAGKLAANPNKRGYWDTAIVNLTAALNISKDLVDYTNLGWAYYNSAQVDLANNKKPEADAKLQKAKTNLLEATKLGPQFPAAFLNLGVTQSDLGEYPPAIVSLKHALELRNDWVPALNELGIAYRKSNDFENAIKQFRRTTEIDSNFVSGYYNLGESEFQRGNIKETKKAYQKLLALNTAKSKFLAVQLEILTKGAVRR